MKLYEVQGIDSKAHKNMQTTIIIIGVIIVACVILILLKKYRAHDKHLHKTAHDLRTVLSIIKMNSEMKLLKPGIDTESKKTFEDIIEEITRATKIINNLLK